MHMKLYNYFQIQIYSSIEEFLLIKVAPCSILHGSLHGNPKKEKLSLWIAMANNSLRPNWFVSTPSSTYLAFQATAIVQEWLTLRVWSKVAWAIAMLWHRWGDERRVWGMVDGKNLTQIYMYVYTQTYRYSDRHPYLQTYRIIHDLT